MKFAIVGSVLSIFLASVSSQTTFPAPIAGSDETVVRDPSIFYNSDSKKYFVFSTGNNISIFTSPTLNGPWPEDDVGSVLPDCSVIDLPGNCVLWAPDISFNDGLYTLYYAVSTFGTQNSAIGVATSSSMEPGTWTDLGEVISSAPGDSYNTIDPNLISDSVGLQLVFGSYWDGMFQIDLSPGVNDQASPLPGNHLAGASGRPAEGAFVYKPTSQPFYYFFFSDGVTPVVGSPRPAAGTEYKVLVGRGADAQGPFFDELGNDLVSFTAGSLVLGSHDNVFAPGGQSIYADPISGRDVIVYHYVKLSDPVGGPSYLGINYLDFSSGWPVVVA
ncbi:glycoside hydrolase family 43 protein [Rhodocollybia butyracea]|uniref:Arabinan endo-1,5-alpha-L-arabinosidase n=1 Tax=Rhodocollybia butyracea TaxID=206335 RepID=A0A9P5PS13_9AGAR|nr:glycoside hydrolase family 43 protein [Rhodocollybia butyracea]